MMSTTIYDDENSPKPRGMRRLSTSGDYECYVHDGVKIYEYFRKDGTLNLNPNDFSKKTLEQLTRLTEVHQNKGVTVTIDMHPYPIGKRIFLGIKNIHTMTSLEVMFSDTLS